MSQLVLGNGTKHTLNLRCVGARGSKVSCIPAFRGVDPTSYQGDEPIQFPGGWMTEA